MLVRIAREALANGQARRTLALEVAGLEDELREQNAIRTLGSPLTQLLAAIVVLLALGLAFAAGTLAASL